MYTDAGQGLCSVGGGLCAAPPRVCLTAIGKIVDAAVLHIPAAHPGVRVDTYCIMPDHIHLILDLEPGRDRARPLPDIIGRLKSYTQQQYRSLASLYGPKLWQRGFYDHVIRGGEDLEETRRYILENLAKWKNPTKWQMTRTDTNG